MSRKRKCRQTAEEQAIHEEAVRLRKMTDKQLVEEFHRAAEPEETQETPESVEPNNDTAAVKKLLEALAEGQVKGIKSGIAYKVSQLAKEMGLV